MKIDIPILTSPARMDSAATQNVERPGLSLMGRSFAIMRNNLESERDPSLLDSNKSPKVTGYVWQLLTMGEETVMAEEEWGGLPIHVKCCEMERVGMLTLRWGMGRGRLNFPRGSIGRME